MLDVLNHKDKTDGCLSHIPEARCRNKVTIKTNILSTGQVPFLSSILVILQSKVI